MRNALAFALLFALASCVTSAPTSSQWTKIEGCWGEHWADHWPAQMEWRRDPANPGGYLGHWQREAAQMDMEHVYFALTPSGDQMVLCMKATGAADRCAPAVFGRAGWTRDGVAVVDVQRGYHEFGFAGASLPFFWGARRDCN